MEKQDLEQKLLYMRDQIHVLSLEIQRQEMHRMKQEMDFMLKEITRLCHEMFENERV